MTARLLWQLATNAMHHRNELAVYVSYHVHTEITNNYCDDTLHNIVASTIATRESKCTVCNNCMTAKVYLKLE